MGEITEAFRAGKICSPTSYKFCKKTWSEYISTKTIGNNDEEIVRAVNFVQEMHDNIKHYLRIIGIDKLDRKMTIRGVIGNINRQLYIIKEEIRAQLKTKMVHSSAELFSSVKHDLLGGYNKATGDQIVQSMLGSLQYPLMYAKTNCSNDTKKESKDFIDIIISAINLADFHCAVTDVWNGILYDQLYFYENDFQYFAHIKNSYLSKKYMASIFRRKLSYIALDRIIKQSDDYHLKYSHGVLKINGAGKNKKIHIVNSDQENNIHLATIQFLINKQYDDDILNYKMESINDITLQQLVLALAMLQGFFKSAESYSRQSANLKSSNAFTNFAIKVSKNDIIRSFIKIPTITPDQAKKITEIFTYKIDDYNVDMLAHFFVEYDGELYPILPALVPDPIFIVEYWMRIGNFPLAHRGKLFEENIRDKFNKIDSAFQINAVNHAIKFKTDRDMPEEEIDFAFMLNDVLYVCEIKCSLISFDHYSLHIFHNMIDKACAQCERKAKYINENIKIFSDRYFNGITPKTVKTIVITNNEALSGAKINDTIITDDKILLNFFNITDPKYFGETENTPTYKLPHNIYKYYSSPNEAYKNFESYLANPPQMALFENNMSLNLTFIPRFAPNYKDLIKFTFHPR